MRRIHAIFLLSICIFPAIGCADNVIKDFLLEGFTPLMRAAKTCDTPELERLISKGSNIDRKSWFSWTALMFAVSEGHEKCVIMLLDAGADPNIISKEISNPFKTAGGTPPTTALNQAITKGHLSIAHLLVDRGASIDTRSRSRAGKYADISLLEKLKVRGVDFNQAGPNDLFNTPLIEASEMGNIENVKWLLKNGIDPNIIVYRRTALGEAAKGNQPEVVKYLLNNGADPNLIYGPNPELYGTTAIHDAVFRISGSTAEQCRNNLKSIEILLSKDADRNYIRPSDDHTLLEKLKMRQQKMIKDLQESDYDKDIQQQYFEAIKCDEAKIKLLQE